MKKLIALFLLLFIVGTTLTEAQRRQRGPRLTQEERVDRLTTHLYVALELDDAQMKSVKSSLNTHFSDVKKLVLESEERPNREEFKKLGDTRDEAIKGVLNEEQAQKYDRMQERLQQRTRMARRNFNQRGRRGFRQQQFRRGFRGGRGFEHPGFRKGLRDHDENPKKDGTEGNGDND